jgi:hypothetical protein
MAFEKDFELLDDYLANRLSADEKAQFEKQLEADPSLKQEFNIQQRLVDGIRKARLAELKGMLNNTPIPAPGGQALLAKLGVFAVVAGLVATGAYYFFGNDTAEVKPLPPVAVQDEPAPKQEPVLKEKANDTVAKQEEEAIVPTPEKPVVIAEEKKASKEKAPAATKDSAETTAAKPEKPSAFDPTSEEPISEPSYETLEKSFSRTASGSSIAIDVVPDNKNYPFHYQFKEGKLLLYGQPFKDKNLIEIREYFKNSKRTAAILFYKENYYNLDEGNETITALRPIKDPAILKKLKESRGN